MTAAFQSNAFQSDAFAVAVTVGTTYPASGAPISDVSAGGWVPNIGGSLYETLNESTPDTGDYDIDTSSGSAMEVLLEQIVSPFSSTEPMIHYSISAISGAITVSLKQGAGTVIASWTHNPAPASPTIYNQTLSAAEVAAVTDYADLRIRVTSSSGEMILMEDGSPVLMENGSPMLME